jgi:RimJ/RimL family protein N-acetyltransferase
MKPPKLLTSRLQITHFEATDTAFIYELLNSPQWLQFIGDRNIKNEQDALRYIQESIFASYQQHGFGFYKVSLLDGTPIGMCGLIKRPNLPYIDIGFAFLPRYTNNGYGFESAQSVMNYAFNELKVSELAGITLTKNIASIKLLEKLGMKFKEMIRLNKDGEELMLFFKSIA